MPWPMFVFVDCEVLWLSSVLLVVLLVLEAETPILGVSGARVSDMMISVKWILV